MNIDWHQLDRLVMFGMGFVYAVIIFVFLPELWKDIKEMWTTLTGNSSDATDEQDKIKHSNYNISKKRNINNLDRWS